MLRVVLVDDEPAILRRLTSIIRWEDLGCTVVARAADGEDGLAAAREHHADLVVADIRMPVIDGLRLAELLSQLDDPPAVILLTGYGEFEYARAAIRAGVSDYLLKPVDPAKLSEAVARVRTRRAVKGQPEIDATRRRWAQAMVCGNGDPSALVANLGFEPGRSTFHCIVVRGSARTPAIASSVTAAAGLVPIVTSEGPREFELVAVLSGNAAEPIEEFGRRLLSAAYDGEERTVVGIGAPVYSPGKLGTALADARRTANHAFYVGGGVMLAGEVPPFCMEGSELRRLRSEVESARARLSSVVSTMEVSGMGTVLSDLGGTIRRVHPSPDLAGEFLLDVSLSIKRDFGGDNDVRDYLGASRSYASVRTLDDYLSALERQIRDTVRRRGAKWGVRVEPVSRWVLRYIETHYTEAVTLRSIGEIVNLNPVYLGQRFREETGMSFHEALLKTRMDVAAKALRTSQTPIHVIASQVGYEAPVNFYKGFRKVHGTSPASYRRRALGHQE